MASSVRIPSATERTNDEESHLKYIASHYGCYCIYKLGQESGWSHYKPINNSAEERQIPGSSWKYAAKVYDRGRIMNIDGKWDKSLLIKNKRWYEFWK